MEQSITELQNLYCDILNKFKYVYICIHVVQKNIPREEELGKCTVPTCHLRKRVSSRPLITVTIQVTLQAKEASACSCLL